MSISHLFENKIVFSNEKRNINPTSLLNFNISTVSIPVVPNTPGEIALTILVPSSRY